MAQFFPRAPRALHLRVLAALAASTLPVAAQSRFATHVLDYTPGSNPNPSFSDPSRALGGPRGGGLGGGSTDILVLGIGGHVTLGFGVTIVDGPGADLTVAENGFTFGGGGVFAEVAYVEVSTDGLSFARFPSRYSGPIGPLPAFGTSPMGTFSGLCGGLPVLANVLTNTVDPLDPARSGGDSLDLADLAGEPAVLSGAVDLQAIHYVRLVDVEAGVGLDGTGVAIWDHGGASGSADVDAVTALQHAGLSQASLPIVDFRWTPTGHAELFLGDGNGFQDLDLATLSVSIDLQPVSFQAIRPLFRLASRTPQGVWLRSQNPLAGAGMPRALAVSVRDRSGQLSGDHLIVPN